jgi:hypothetical protein
MSLYKFIRNERLIYYLNRDQIKFNRTKPSQIHEWLGSS